MAKIEFFVAVNEDGDFEINTENPNDAATELWNNAGGEVARVVKATMDIDLPVLEEVHIKVPASAGTTKTRAEVE